MSGFYFKASGRQETDQISAFYFLSITTVYTSQCECEDDCPGRDSDEVPNRILEAMNVEDSFIG